MAEEDKMNQRVLFLYTELAGYTVACLNHLVKTGIDVAVVRWPVNKEAPFQFVFSPEISVYEREELDARELLSLAAEFHPDAIYCSGWVDRDYLRVCKAYRSEIPVVVGFDNQWQGSFKQRLAGFLSRWTIQTYFSHAWIPGTPQLPFAEKLGFKPDKILKGVYAADTQKFNDWYTRCKDAKKAGFPHRFLFVGRYVEWKGIRELWSAFAELKNKNDWELWCIGTGDLYESRPEIDGVRHIGFVQPEDLETYAAGTGVFILPSKFEPWGVALHEFAAAGFPIITTPQTGASSAFVKPGLNGWFAQPEAEHLRTAMEMVMACSDAELLEMGEKSNELAMELTPEIWAETMRSIL